MMENHASFTFRGIVAGLVIDVLINVSNTYYGLQSGYSNQIPILSALLSFIVFRASRMNFSAVKSVLTTSVATATGCMPVTAGLTGVIPAIEYVLEARDGGRIHFKSFDLIVWSIGVAGFGLLFASLLWTHFTVQEDLPWPGPKATAAMVRTLYNMPETAQKGPPDDDLTHRIEDEAQQTTVGPSEGILNETIQIDAGKSKLLTAGVTSDLITVLMYFIPILRDVPLFGNAAAHEYLWTVNLSPGFFGQGIITGPIIPLHMLLGSITGWALLAPMVRWRGWAPGKIEDWESGGRGWIIWVAVAGLMADAFVKLTWLIIRPIWTFVRIHHARSSRPTRDQPASSDHARLLVDGDIDTDQTYCSTQVTPLDPPMQPRALIKGFVIATLVCVIAVHISFGNVIPWYGTLLAVVLALPMAVVGIRSLAEADFNPESALFSQIVFATIIPTSNVNAMMMNILSAGLAQAGASQAGDVSFDFKVGHLIGAPARPQLLGQVIGSIFGALISCLTYRLYTSQYSIPGPLFQIPSAYLDVTIAKLVMGRGLPEGVIDYVVGFGVFFTLATIVKMRFANTWWQHLIPSGISFAIGMYNIPSFTLARVAGGIFYWVRIRKNPGRREELIISASGLVMGESLASLLALAFATLKVPQIKMTTGD